MSTNALEMTAEQYLERMAACGVTPLDNAEISGAIHRSVEKSGIQAYSIQGKSPGQESILGILTTGMQEKHGKENDIQNKPEDLLADINTEYKPNTPTGPNLG